MKKRDYIVVADRDDESAVDYTMDRCGISRFWVPTPFGIKICTVEATLWMLAKFFILLAMAHVCGQKLHVQMRRAPGE